MRNFFWTEQLPSGFWAKTNAQDPRLMSRLPIEDVVRRYICRLLFVLMALFPIGSSANPSVPSPSSSALGVIDNFGIKSVIQKYKNAQQVELTVDKRVTSKILGTIKDYTGRIYYSKSLFQWLTESPEKSQVIYDGKYIWTIQSGGADFGNAPQVLRTKIDKKKSAQLFLSQLFRDDGVVAQFDHKVGDRSWYRSEQLEKEAGVLDLRIGVEIKENLLFEISYKDDLGNQTVLKFSKTEFIAKRDPTKYRYRPSRGTRVVDL